MHTQEQCIKKKLIFHSVSTMLSITSPSKAGLYSNPTGVLRLTHIRSYAYAHILFITYQLSADMWMLGWGKVAANASVLEGQMVSCKFIPSLSLQLCLSVCAAWAEAGIDTIHHECKLAT